MALQLKEGGYYRNRAGNIVGPIFKRVNFFARSMYNDKDFPWGSVDANKIHHEYRDNGIWSINPDKTFYLDLVEEIGAEPDDEEVCF